MERESQPWCAPRQCGGKRPPRSGRGSSFARTMPPTNDAWQVAPPRVQIVTAKRLASVAIPVAVAPAVAVPAATVAAAVATVAAPGAGAGRHAALGLGQQRLAREADLAVAIHADHLDHHDVADIEHVLGAGDAMVVD